MTTKVPPPLSPFEALDDPNRKLGLDEFLKELESWKFLPKGDPGEPERAADLLGLRLVPIKEANPWGDYHFGPVGSGTTATGEEVTCPPRDNITADLLPIWQQRASSARHPVLRHRYADLVWDLSKLAAGRPADVTFARLAIDAAIEALANDKFSLSLYGYAAAERALSIARSLRDRERQSKVEHVLLAYERSRAEDHHSGTWGQSFDLLVEGDSLLAEEERAQVVSDLEARLGRIADSASPVFDPHGAEAAALRLARLYHKQKKQADIERVLRVYASAFTEAAAHATGGVASSWLDSVHSVLYEFGLKAQAAAIEPLAREHGRRSMGDLREFSTTLTIEDNEVEDIVASLKRGSADETLLTLAAGFVPDKALATRQMHDLARQAPLQAHIPIVKVDSEGRRLAQIGSLQSDPDGRLVHHIANQLALSAPLLRLVIERARTKIPIDIAMVMDQVRQSPVFAPERCPIVEEGLELYFAGQHVAAAHTLIPQIEAAVRRLASLIGAPTHRLNEKTKGMDARMLDDLLRDTRVEAVLSQSLYLRVLLSDRRGWNLRNEICHGLLDSASFGPQYSDRIFHAILVLAGMRAESKSKGAVDSEGGR